MLDLSENEDYDKYVGNESLAIHSDLKFTVVFLDLGPGKDFNEM